MGFIHNESFFRSNLANVGSRSSCLSSGPKADSFRSDSFEDSRLKGFDFLRY